MKRLAFIVALSVGAALLMAARPGDDHTMFTLLNGQETRWVMADGGASGMFGSGVSCMPLSQLPAASNLVVEVLPTTPINLCYVNTTATGATGWDGGCGMNAGDIHQGVSLQPWIPKYVVLKSTTTHLCQVSDAGTATTAVFGMQ